MRQSIEAHRDEIIAIGEYIRMHPDPRYREFRAAGVLSEHLRGLCIPHETGIAIAGVEGMLAGRRSDVTVAYMGKLDFVRVRDHPDADPQIGATHQKLAQVYQENATALVGEDECWEPAFGARSTDLGDVSHIMPAIESQPRGSSGTGRGAD